MPISNDPYLQLQKSIEAFKNAIGKEFQYNMSYPIQPAIKAMSDSFVKLNQELSRLYPLPEANNFKQTLFSCFSAINTEISESFNADAKQLNLHFSEILKDTKIENDNIYIPNLLPSVGQIKTKHLEAVVYSEKPMIKVSLSDIIAIIAILVAISIAITNHISDEKALNTIIEHIDNIADISNGSDPAQEVPSPSQGTSLSQD
jgi:hypothetical protein